MDITVIFDRDGEEETITYERTVPADEHLHSVLGALLGALQAGGYGYVEALEAHKGYGGSVSTDQWRAE